MSDRCVETSWGPALYPNLVPGPDHPPLTRDEVAALPDGTRVVILWSGGNGAGEYVIRWSGGEQYVLSAHEVERGFTDTSWNDPLSFIGDRRFHTKVWLAGGER